MRRLDAAVTMMIVAALVVVPLGSGTAGTHQQTRPWWTGAARPVTTIVERIAPPAGFERTPVSEGTFAAWLRDLPLKEAGAPVHLFNGALKWRQDVHEAVLDVDVGPRNLQQCADAIMRLRAEWLLASGRANEIAFNDSEGKRLTFKGGRKADYAAFRKYMVRVFAYAGTYSLDRELKAVPASGIQAGDVFIKGGFPGHAILVVDIVQNAATGERRLLLAQSYMPAQDIHILKNFTKPELSPWYAIEPDGSLATPEWLFPKGSLKRWP